MGSGVQDRARGRSQKQKKKEGGNTEPDEAGDASLA